MIKVAEKKIHNRYIIREEIAKGSLSLVYRAYDRQTRTDVALKFVSPGSTDPEKFFDAILHEVERIRHLEHSNVANYQECERYGDYTLLVMPYIDGPSLKDVMAHYPNGMPVAEALRIIGALANALSFLGSNGVSHQDVTPANILFDTVSQQPWLIDFRLAAIARREEGPKTAAYLSPEQSADAPADARTDVYALGVIAFELLTGERPYQGDSAEAAGAGSLIKRVQWEHQHAPIPSLSALRSDLLPETDAVFARALAKTPSQRYTDAFDFFDDLQKLLQDRSQRLASEEIVLKNLLQRRRAPSRRYKLGCLLPAVLAGAILGGLGYTAYTIAPLLRAPVQSLLTVLTQTSVPTNTQQPSMTPTFTFTPTLPPSATPTASATPTVTHTPTRFPTATPRPSDTPAPSATPTPSSVPANVLGTTPINVRSSPDTNSAVIGQLNAGTRVQVIGRNEDSAWLRVRLPGAEQAWIRADLLSLSQSQIAQLPISR